MWSNLALIALLVLGCRFIWWMVKTKEQLKEIQHGRSDPTD
jgi:hypothetical protein